MIELDADLPLDNLGHDIKLDYVASEPSVDDEHDDGQLLEDNKDDAWYNKSLEDKWKDVVQRLINKEVRWDIDKDRDDGWEPDGVRVLDLKEKKSLTDVDVRNKTCPTVLHRLARGFEDDGFSKLSLETQIQVVEYLLNERKESKNIADSPEDPILTRAFEYQNTEFIRLIIKNFENHIPDLVDDQDSGGVNCLHYIFKKHIPECIDELWKHPCLNSSKYPITLKLGDTIKFAFYLITFAKPCSIVASDSEGNTPIHYALAYRVSRGTSLLPVQDLVLKLLKAGDEFKDRSRQFNKAQQSPYLYLSHTRQEFVSQNARLRSQKLTSTPIKSQRPGSKSSSGQTRSTRDEMVSRNVKDAYLDNSKDVPMNMKAEASLKYPPQHYKENMKRDLSTVNQQLLTDKPKNSALTRRKTVDLRDNVTDALRPEPPTASPDVEVGDLTSARRLEIATGLNSGRNVVSGKPPPTAESPLHGQQNGRESTGGSGKEAAQELKGPEKRKTDKSKEDHTVCVEAAENIHQQLKLHYIRSRSDVEAKELLYGRIASGELFLSFHVSIERNSQCNDVRGDSSEIG
jgi:ankyrin repeat protein